MSGPGVSWIYQLYRDELIRYLEENQLPAAASDTVADMRARLVQFIREISPTQTMERIPSMLAASFFEEEVEEGTSIPADIAAAFFAEDLQEGPSSPPPPPTPPAKTSPLLLVAGPSGTCPLGRPLTADEKRGFQLHTSRCRLCLAAKSWPS
ncbi:uncharacterized protein LOC134527703 [Bacillus rossius redtenbacheri]|uniref:uncharacterized protein LOC134527703 n=1 Tax=Bacillus rossius redtenbacheri TaxID=93214 RepID=UPI002FDF079E